MVLPKICFRSNITLLSSSPCWVILMISGLFLGQKSSLRAMNEGDESKHPKTSLSSSLDGKEKERVMGFYKDSDHPLTQELWKKNDLSERLLRIKEYIELKRRENQDYRRKEDLQYYKDILKCSECKTNPATSIKHLHYPAILYAKKVS